MITKMTKYSFILLSGDEASFLQKIQEIGMLDISRSKKAVDEKSGSQMAELETLHKRISDIENSRYARDQRYLDINAEITAAKAELKLRKPWGDFSAESLEKLHQQGIKLHFHCVSAKKFDKEWLNDYAIEIISEEDSKLWFVVITREGEDYNFPVNELPAPAGSASDCQKTIDALQVEKRSREIELDAEKEFLPQLKAEYRAKAADLDLYMAGAAAGKAAEDAITTFIAYAPTKFDAKVQETLTQMDGIYYTSEAACVEDNPPIQLENNAFARMFEFFTDMYGRPGYNGFDPTPYIAVFFTLFFAMCMGDAGYGLLLVFLGLALKKVKSFAEYAPLVVTLGGATVFAGLIFHTVFSIDLLSLESVPQAVKNFMIPSKIAGYDGTMVVALVVGIFHLCVALIVKTVYATKNEGLKGSISVWSWTILLVGASVIGALVACGMPAETAKKAFIAIGTISALGIFPFRTLGKNPLVNIGAGLWETYNTATGLLGDVLSYLRLYALGLAGSMLGLAFNTIAQMVLGDGGIMWIPFILIVIVGHTLNIAIAALGAFVHPLRLNFLEFFKNSNYEALGTNYNPLKK